MTKQTEKSWEKEFRFGFSAPLIDLYNKEDANMKDFNDLIKRQIKFISKLLAKQREEMIEGLNDNYWLARVFHNECEGLAERYGWKTNKKTRVRFEDLPDENLKLMLATCKLVLWHIRAKLKTNTTKEEK